MKNINVMFEDAEYKAVKKKKGNLTWKEYILNIKRGGKNDRRS